MRRKIIKMGLLSRFVKKTASKTFAHAISDFEMESRKTMQKIIALIVAAIIIFLVFFLYGLNSSIKSAQQLIAIQDVFFQY